VFDRIVYPFLKSKKIEFGMLKRIGSGFCLISLGMIYAGLLEVYRLHLFSRGHWFTQKVGNNYVIAVDLTVLSQAPAYFLIGAGEVLASVTGLEFAYSQAPPTMKSLVLAVFYLTFAAGNYLGSLIVFIVNAITAPHPWIGKDLNHSHMDLYFFLLAALSVINIFIYIFISMNYQMREQAMENDKKGRGRKISTLELSKPVTPNVNNTPSKHPRSQSEVVIESASDRSSLDFDV